MVIRQVVRDRPVRRLRSFLTTPTLQTGPVRCGSCVSGTVDSSLVRNSAAPTSGSTAPRRAGGSGERSGSMEVPLRWRLVAGGGQRVRPCHKSTLRRDQPGSTALGPSTRKSIVRVGTSRTRSRSCSTGCRSTAPDCCRFAANQFRVPLTAAAYVLLQELRLCAARTACARTQVTWLRDRLLKLGVHCRPLRPPLRPASAARHALPRRVAPRSSRRIGPTDPPHQAPTEPDPEPSP